MGNCLPRFIYKLETIKHVVSLTTSIAMLANRPLKINGVEHNAKDADFDFSQKKAWQYLPSFHQPVIQSSNADDA